MIVDDYDKYNPLAPSKVKGFLFAYFLDFLITLINSIITVANRTNLVINTITVTKVAMLGIILSYSLRLNAYTSPPAIGLTNALTCLPHDCSIVKFTMR